MVAKCPAHPLTPLRMSYHQAVGEDFVGSQFPLTI